LNFLKSDFVCSCGNVLNADVNGALNILKKVAGESVRILGSGGVNPLVRTKLPAFGKQTPHEASL